MTDIPFLVLTLLIAITFMLPLIAYIYRTRFPISFILFICGAIWIFLFITTDNIDLSYATDIPRTNDTIIQIPSYSLNYPMNVITSDASVSLQTANFGLAERPVNIDSLLYNVKISCISMDISKTGAPTGTATIGILGGTSNIIKTFGTVDVATGITTTQRTYTFCLSNHDYWVISLYDKIGIFYNTGTAGNGLNIYTQTTGFDGTNSVRATLSSAGTWTDSSTTDVRMILTTELISIENTGTYTNTPFDNATSQYQLKNPITGEPNFVSIMFMFLGSIFILVGILVETKWN